MGHNSWHHDVDLEAFALMLFVPLGIFVCAALVPHLALKQSRKSDHPTIREQRERLGCLWIKSSLLDRLKAGRPPEEIAAELKRSHNEHLLS